MAFLAYSSTCSMGVVILAEISRRGGTERILRISFLYEKTLKCSSASLVIGPFVEKGLQDRFLNYSEFLC